MLVQKFPENLELSFTLFDHKENMFVRAYIFKPDGSIEQVNLAHKFGGVYEDKGWAPPVEGKYLINYKVYKDAAFTKLVRKYSNYSEAIISSRDFENTINKLNQVSDEINENIDDQDSSIQ